MDETTQDVSTEQVTDANPQEQQDTKKPFLKTWKPWVIALALIFFWAWCQNPANSYDAKKKEKARNDYYASVKSFVQQSFDGCDIKEDGDILTVSFWSNDVTVYSAAVLVLTDNLSTITDLEQKLLTCGKTFQSKADEMGTGYTVCVRLMDSSDTSSPLCIVQNGVILRHITD